MQNGTHEAKPKLPGNHGQFGEDTATEEHRPLRATQAVTVKPVVPRGNACLQTAASPNATEDVSEAHPS